MWLTKFFTAVMVILTGLLPSSCTKSKSPAAQNPATAPEVSTASNNTSNDKNLGELELTNHYETCVQLGAGKSCTIKPNLIDRKDLQLTMALQSKNPDGKTAGLSVIQVVARPGESFEVAVGDMNLTLTPRLADE
jgi:hypothetical protein